MTTTTLFLTVAGAHLLGVLSPGPDFAVVLRQTLAHGRRSGMLTALGIATGITAHVSWAMFGMTWASARWAPLSQWLQFGGALFLLWLGAQAIRAKPAGAGSGAPQSGGQPGLRAYWIGLLTNLGNGKALLFFMALCATVITPEQPPGLRLGLALWMVLSTGLWFSLLAIGLGHPAVRQRLHASAHWIDRAMGAVLIALGLGMLIQLR